jgi:hypothetical protein
VLPKGNLPCIELPCWPLVDSSTLITREDFSLSRESPAKSRVLGRFTLEGDSRAGAREDTVVAAVSEVTAVGTCKATFMVLEAAVSQVAVSKVPHRHRTRTVDATLARKTSHLNGPEVAVSELHCPQRWATWWQGRRGHR